jgi:hypothetical protein
VGQPTIRLVEPENSSEQTTRPGYLYRHFDAAGSLLYVGKSVKHLERLAQHRATAHWYDRIAVIKIERFPTEAEALAAEDVAIKTENPECNIAPGNSNYPPYSRAEKRDEVLDRIDQQTAVGQRIVAVYLGLKTTYHRAVDVREDLLRQAELTVMAERLRSEWLNKPSQGLLDQVLRVEGLLKRGRK